MSARRFLDTNVLVYLYDRRADAPLKTQRSEELLAAGDNVISAQVLGEFFNAATRKLAMSPSGALERMQRLASLCAVVPIDATLALAAGRRSVRDQLSYWDALIVEAALCAGCRVLFSEDFQSGRKYGDLVVQSPYEPERPRPGPARRHRPR